MPHRSAGANRHTASPSRPAKPLPNRPASKARRSRPRHLLTQAEAAGGEDSCTRRRSAGSRTADRGDGDDRRRCRRLRTTLNRQAPPSAVEAASAAEAPAAAEEPKPILIWRPARFDQRPRHRHEARGRDGARPARGAQARTPVARATLRGRSATAKPRSARPARNASSASSAASPAAATASKETARMPARRKGGPNGQDGGPKGDRGGRRRRQVVDHAEAA